MTAGCNKKSPQRGALFVGPGRFFAYHRAMRETAFPQIDKNIVADDGDAFTFCSTCAFSRACLSQGMDKASLRDLHMLVEHIGPLHPGDHVFRAGDPFEAIAAVPAKDGSVRFYLLSDDNFQSSQRTLLLAFDWKPAR